MANFRNARITIVDDDEDAALLVGRLLQAAIPSVVSIESDGLAGLRACLNNAPDLVFLDLEMPGLRGEEICRVLRVSEHFRDTPIVILSGLPDADRRELDLLKLGADAYIRKPFDNDEIVTTAKEVLAKYGRAFSTEPAEIDEIEFGDRKTAPTLSPVSLSLPKKWSAMETEFAGCRIIGTIGQGGMGCVFRARQADLERDVAIKVLLKKWDLNEDMLGRFKLEARIMAKLAHPNIIKVHSYGDTGLTQYIIMELIDGPSLGKMEKGGGLKLLTIAQRGQIAIECCAAISYLHASGVIHRDIKPENVLLTKELSVRVTDFGLSRLVAPKDEIASSELHALLGTPYFMAPEQHKGAPACVATDIYSLGMTLDILFSSLPDSCEEDSQDRRLEVVQMIVRRCCELEPDRRPQSIDEILKMLQSIFASSSRRRPS